MRFDDIGRAMSVHSEIERQRRLVASVQTQILTAQTGYERVLDDLTRLTSLSPAVDLQLSASDLLVSPTYTGLGQQTQRLVSLMERPELFTALGGLSDVPNVLVEQARRYRDDLRDEVVDEVALAEAAPVPASDVLARLADERQAILICLKRFAAILVVAHSVGSHRLSDVVLGLIVAFVAIGEVADEMLGERYDDAA